MSNTEKAKELFELFYKRFAATDTCFGTCEDVKECSHTGHGCHIWAKEAKACALIAVGNEYHEKRELLFLLKSNRIITDDKAYLHFSDLLINEEQEVKTEIEKL